MPQHHASVPHPWPDRRGAGLGESRRGGLLHAGLQCAEVLRLGGRGATLLVFRRADHASGDPAARQAQCGGIVQAEPAFCALVVGILAARCVPRTGGDLRLSGDRGLRHDRGDPPDGIQPAAARRTEAGVRRSAGRSGNRHPRSGRYGAAAGLGRRSLHPRRQCYRRICEQPQGQCREFHRWLVPHRGPGFPRSGRLSEDHRTHQGNHQPGRGEGLAAGSRRCLQRPSGGAAGRDLRPAAQDAGRGSGRRRRPGRRGERHREGSESLWRGTPCRFQDSEEVRVPG